VRKKAKLQMQKKMAALAKMLSFECYTRSRSPPSATYGGEKHQKKT
jgi:hypothetical protein